MSFDEMRGISFLIVNEGDDVSNPRTWPNIEVKAELSMPPLEQKSRTPSVEARLVETKQNLHGNLERLFLLYFHSFYSVSTFLILFLHLFFSYCFSIFPYTDLLSLEFGYFWPEGPACLEWVHNF
jgi:hypothetical protein